MPPSATAGRHSHEDHRTITVTSRAERARRAELAELARLMRERVGLASAPVPVPLHRMGQRRRQETATVTSLPRCPVPACPIRYRTGDNRLCAHHRNDDSTVSLAERMTAMGVDVTAAPAGRHDGEAAKSG